MHKPLILVCAIGCLSACTTVGPDYAKPIVSTPASFSSKLPEGETAELDGDSFWADFSDGDLPGLVAMALVANHDLRIASAALREVRGLRSEVRGGLFPTGDVRGSLTRDRSSLTQLPGTTISQRTGSLIDLEFDSGWELDLFGGVRRSVEAASAQVEASQADLDAMRISVAAETARTYFEMRGIQRRIEVADDNLKNQIDTLGVVTTRFNAGRGTDFDISRARGLVETTRAAIPALQASLARASYSLAVLIGQPPGSTAALLVGSPAVAAAPPVFVVADPKTLLRRRPDVVAAERRVAAASASIGVNTAELFPSVTFIGDVGLTATRGGDLSKGNALKYTVGPTLSWNVFDFGRIRSRIEQSNARHDASLAAYERVILRALEDAEGALETMRRVNEQAVAVSASADAARTAAHLATLRFDAGATDLLDLLDAQRQVLAAEDRLTQIGTARVIASVALFKAMGGGWTSPQIASDEDGAPLRK